MTTDLPCDHGLFIGQLWISVCLKRAGLGYVDSMIFDKALTSLCLSVLIYEKGSVSLSLLSY